jgi:hypothetical protein
MDYTASVLFRVYFKGRFLGFNSDSLDIWSLRCGAHLSVKNDYMDDPSRDLFISPESPERHPHQMNRR